MSDVLGIPDRQRSRPRRADRQYAEIAGVAGMHIVYSGDYTCMRYWQRQTTKRVCHRGGFEFRADDFCDVCLPFAFQRYDRLTVLEARRQRVLLIEVEAAAVDLTERRPELLSALDAAGLSFRSHAFGLLYAPLTNSTLVIDRQPYREPSR